MFLPFHLGVDGGSLHEFGEQLLGTELLVGEQLVLGAAVVTGVQDDVLVVPLRNGTPSVTTACHISPEVFYWSNFDWLLLADPGSEF